MIMVTGNLGYIGPVMTGLLKERSYEVVGLDSGYFRGCEFFPPDRAPARQIVKDLRDVTKADLAGVRAVIHLAALSNDPLGEISPGLTKEINAEASLRLAALAREAGAERFIFASSCSLYGIAADETPLTEAGRLNPITAYAKAKVDVEEGLRSLACDHFHPVCMRNATVYGVSPLLRLDLVVNNLVAWGHLTGRITIMSDGTPWRPIVHVEDFCRAFIAVLEASSEEVHGQAFNVGINEENYQVREIAEAVRREVPGCVVEIRNQTGPDERSYRVDFSKIRDALPGFRPAWNLQKGIRELYDAYGARGLTLEEFDSAKYFRLRWVRSLLDARRLDRELRWV